jgi:UDP:flavonoid glycosyltransferase YjiC (YdhE family)
MRVLITTIGSAGDVHPYVPIGEELVRRGHEVAFLANPFYAPRLPGSFRFVPLGSEEELRDAFGELAGLGPLGSMLRLVGWVTDHVEPTVETLRATLRDFRPDCVLRHVVHAGVLWACEEAGVPCVSGAVAPAAWLSVEERVADQRPFRRTRRVGWRAARGGLRLVGRATLERKLARLRARLGLAPRRDLLGAELLGGRARLGLWSRALRPPMPDDPPESHVCGFSTYDWVADDGDQEEVESFLDAGEPPIVFTLGSTGVHSDLATTFYRSAVEVCRRTGRRGLLLTGRPPSFVGSTPDSVLAVPYAAHSRVHPRAALVVTHAGVGSVAPALRAGVPVVSVPLLFEQPDLAFRLERLGVGPVVWPRRLGVRALERAVRRVLEDGTSAARARELSSVVATEDASATVADLLEDLGA